MSATMSTRLRCLASAAAVLVLAAAHAALQAQELPTGLSFVAQDRGGGAWQLYRIDQRRQAVPVPTQLEPRQACITPDGAKLVYAAADGTVRTASPPGGSEVVLARADDKRAYTQPCLGADGRDVVLVELADGKSIDTEILRYSGGSTDGVRIARQPGGQFDPYLHRGRWLVYASVGCSDGCEQLLVEIWTRDLLAAQARQLTLLNALSQSPVTDGQRVVFASNAGGSFQLWQVGLDGSGLRRLTGSGPSGADGAAGRETSQATQPALCGGELYFVRASATGSSIARLAADGRVMPVNLPDLRGFRGLRCAS